MADSSTTTPAAPPAAQPEATPVWGNEALRILLFGMPGVGKTSLLGALAEAAQKQMRDLNGRLVDLSGGLTELQKRLYEGQIAPTAQQVVRYQVEYEPFAQDRVEGRVKDHAILLDCDGRSAHEVLKQKTPLDDKASPGSLPREVLDADTLVLVVDASANATQIEMDFTEFNRFLRVLEISRGQRSDIGGLPVFLVLSKCDLLALPDDSQLDWYERIEDRKRQVYRRFRDFLAKQEQQQGPLPFGRVDLKFWATAIKRPALKGQGAKPREPFGVAGLFRQCLESAKLFNQRQQQSGRRLLWTAGIAATFLAVLAIAAGVFIFNPADTRRLPLQTQVESYRAREEQKTASGRLREPLQERISQLSEFKKHRDFDKMPEDLRNYLERALQELEEYAAYKDKVERAFASLPRKQTDEDLRDLERAAGRIKPPEKYGNEWDQTEATLLLRERLADIKALRDGVQEARDWYQEQTRKSKELTSFNTEVPVNPQGQPETWSVWHGRLRDFLQQADRPPFSENELLRGSKFLRWKSALDFADVVEARSEWNLTRLQLERVRDMSAALGLAGTIADRPALLVIPKDITLGEVAGRVAELERIYSTARYFSLKDLPKNVPELFEPVARRNYENLLIPAQQVVLKQLQEASPDGQETLARWQSLVKWLAQPQELASWRRLAAMLVAIADPNWNESRDPVSQLLVVLGQNTFSIELQSLKLEVAISSTIKPAGQLKVFHPSTNPNAPAIVFEVVEDMDRPKLDNIGRKKFWTLRPVGDTRSLVYKPGDDLWAEMPIVDGDGDAMLTWRRGRSLVWQFERLLKPARQHKRGVPPKETDPMPAELKVLQGNVPTVPDLVPVVKLEKR